MNTDERGAAPPHPAGERMHEFLLAAAALAPGNPAVVEYAGRGDVRTVTYRQLAERADEYAGALAEAGVGVGDCVLLESDTSSSAIAMLAACSSLGAVFVPVSPETPAPRLRWIARTTEPVLFLRTHDTGPERIPPEASGTGRFGPYGVELDRAPAPREDRGWRRGVETDPAYVIFTSGTTGRPKGVVMSHRAVVSFYRGMAACGIVGGSDRVATTSPLQFDFSLLDIGLALGSGAAVVPVPRTLLRWPRRFAAVLRETGATQVNGVPSIWRQTLRREPELLSGLDRVRGVLFCGEEFPSHELRRLQELLPGARMINCYGSTESMAASFAEVPRPLPEDLERLSIGTAHAGAELMIVDGDGRPVDEPGVPGELLLRGPTLFTGYWNDPRATEAALVPDPVNPRTGQRVLRTGDLAHRDEHGRFYFRGRADSQVQIRGNRVELGEIEHRLRDFPGVAGAAAVVVEEPDTDPLLAAFVLPEPGERGPDSTEVIAFCRTVLPEYMVPQRLRVVSELPITENGKVDRGELAARCRGGRPTTER
ncbi:amino acid adenylation domain-containing protein [Streptomyces carminius]|nr:amino acid adenylation domain-containing protein [Streptomyces carminius]